MRCKDTNFLRDFVPNSTLEKWKENFQPYVSDNRRPTYRPIPTTARKGER